MKKLLRAVPILAFAAMPALVLAQGGRGGFGGGHGRRVQTDTPAAGAPRSRPSFADLVFAHRSDLGLTDSQTVAVSDIRMASTSRRAVLNRELDSVKAAMAVTPEDGVKLPSDSSREAMMQRRRALASLLGDLHDVDVNARNETLFVLAPGQKKKAEQLEESADSPSAARVQGGRGGGGRRGAGRPPDGGGVNGP